MRFPTSFFAVLILLSSSWALSAPRYVRVSWTQPDTATTMTLSWTTDSAGDPSIARYGIQSVEEFTAHGQALTPLGEIGATHEVELTGLQPDTVYQYQVGAEGAWSDIGTFRTGPDSDCESFKFAALGDNRPDADWLPQLKWNPILEETVASGPRFILHSGDIVKDGESLTQWRDFLANSAPYMASVPLMPTIGNHDDGPSPGDGSYYAHAFSLPRNEVTQTEDYYYFTYGNAIFVSLSSQTEKGGEFAFETQASWLDQVLTENPKKWKFVFLHHPPYTSHQTFDLYFTEFEFNHPPNENNQNPALIPIFDKHHVDMVFAGHNHYYERFNPLRQGPGPEQGTEVATFAEGTIYIITGGAGALVYDEFEIPFLPIEIDLVQWVCGKAVGSELCAGDHHYVSIEIDDGHLHYEAWATAQQTISKDPDFTNLIDSIDIYKDDDPACLVTPVEEPVVVEQEMDVVSPEPEEILETVSTQDVPAQELVASDLESDKTGSPVELVAGEGTAQDDSLSPEPASDIGIELNKGSSCSSTQESASGASMVLVSLLFGAAIAVLRRTRRI